MKTIREQVIDFMEHNEQLTKLKGENWYKMEDSLVDFIEKLTDKKDTTYTQQEQLPLVDGNYINLVKKEFTIEIQDDLGQVLEEFNLIQGEDTYNGIKKHISKLDKYEYVNALLNNYDYEEDYHRLMETYFEDITLGNGADAVEQEIKDIKKDLETMTEKEFCENYGIFKIGNMYFRS